MTSLSSSMWDHRNPMQSTELAVRILYDTCPKISESRTRTRLGQWTHSGDQFLQKVGGGRLSGANGLSDICRSLFLSSSDFILTVDGHFVFMPTFYQCGPAL
ncbi:hypothetical protein QTP88_013374 [Uroleucon formosanum]